MELSLYDMNTGPMFSCDQMSLGEMLQIQDHPVSEEQAWALCHQLCSSLSQQTWRTVVSAAADGVLFSRDGSVSLRPINSDAGNSFLIETEEQAVEFVGRLVYLSLDWGLETQVERELSETLEILVCHMTKVNLNTDHSCQPICTISDVIQVCKERLYDPSQAVKHYKNVCSSLFSRTVELCHYLQFVQQSRESLQKLFESETQLIAKVTSSWVSTWKDLVVELSRGVELRPLVKRVALTKCPQPPETPPFNQLLRDIQCRRYTLRKVQDAGASQRKPDPHQTLLEFIRSRPKLRPASERKMGLKPKEQSSLHELLMEEIRSINHWKRLAHNRDQSDGSPNKEETEGTSFLKSTPHRIRSDETLGSGNPVQDANFTVPLDIRVCSGKRRTRSFACNRDFFKVVKSRNQGSVIRTIVDVMKMHSSEEKGDLNKMSYERWRVCSCCAMRSLYFTWHNVCSMCRRVMCPGCCIEMLLPSKHYMNLPLSFFKQIVMKDSEQSQRNFWNERWSWNSAWIPLVLVSCGTDTTSVHARAMRDWYSQDICVSCQKDLLEACDSVLSSCPIKDSQEI